MSFRSNRSGYKDWQHSPEGRDLTQFISSERLVHWLISDEPHLWQALIQDWSSAIRHEAAVACLHASSYELLRDKALSPLQQTSSNKASVLVLIILDTQLLSPHTIDTMLQEQRQHPSLKLILCGNNRLLDHIDQRGFGNHQITVLTEHDIRLTYQVLQRLLDKARLQHPNLPDRAPADMITDVHNNAEGQVSRMEAGFTHWLQGQRNPDIQRNIRMQAQNKSSLWGARARRFATQGTAFSLMLGLSITGWQQFSHRKVHTLREPSIHTISPKYSSTRRTQPIAYTVAIATSYSKKQLVRYEKKHHISPSQAHIRRISGKKHRYELDLGDFSSHKAALSASQRYKNNETHDSTYHRSKQRAM